MIAPCPEYDFILGSEDDTFSQEQHRPGRLGMESARNHPGEGSIPRRPSCHDFL